MLWAKRPNLDEIRGRLASPQQQDRVRGMMDLLKWARQDPRVHEAALPIFRQAIASEPDRWTAVYAARGVEVAAGPEAGRAAWLALLDRPEPETVAAVAFSITDPSFAPDLIAVMNRRQDMTIRHGVIRSLGRLRVPGTLSVIVAALDVQELRPDAVQALEDFGDPAAIPHLEALLDDKTDAWEEDNHGPILRVCDVATTAIARLRRGPQPPPASRHVITPPTLPVAGPRPPRWIGLFLVYLACGVVLARLWWAIWG